MALEEYRRKRDFKKTAEPPGEKTQPREAKLSYLIQKHDASHLHYDFRLELDGVLLSWAIPKGPSLDPSDKRLAVRTEDHPVAYGSFEGTIPKGEYGGGTVMLWDTGSWKPVGDPRAGLKKGHLSFILNGRRLKGGWDLVRIRGDQKHENWLLIKHNDEAAKKDSNGDFLDDLSSSVTTGRTMGQIAGTKTTAGSKAPADSKTTVASKATAGSKTTKPKPGNLMIDGIAISHPDRVIDETGHVTKGELAQYYAVVAPLMLPEILRRPISLLRCPSGTSGACFFQRNPGKGLGADIKTFDFKHGGKKFEYLYIEDEKGLLELIQMGTIEIHPWGATIDAIDYPDRMIFDLDPAPEVPFEAIKLAAQDLRQRLERKGLESMLKCSGGKGLHVTAPLPGKENWASVKQFAKDMADEMVAAAPEAYIATMSKEKRKGKIFIDYLRNDYTATSIVDYGVRARPGAPVAVPIEWKELKGLKSGNQFTMKDVLQRVKRKRTSRAAG